MGNAGCLFLCDSLHFLLLFPFSVPSQNRVYFAPSMPGFASGSNAARSRPLGDKLGDAGRIEILKNARGFRGDKVIFAARATNLPRNIPLIIPTACLLACPRDSAASLPPPIGPIVDYIPPPVNCKMQAKSPPTLISSETFQMWCSCRVSKFHLLMKEVR